MSHKDRPRPPGKREYPAFYERAVPIALAIIVVAIVALLIIVAIVLVRG